MVNLQCTVIEKWSKIPLGGALIKLNGSIVLDDFGNPAMTDANGDVIIDVSVGAYEICMAKDGYEDTCQTINLIGNTHINITMKPVFRAL